MNQGTNSHAISRPVLRLYGGGWARASWTVSHFPAHNNYVEPCFGAGSILFNKPLAKLETINDLDDRIINFFKVLRAYPRDLVKLIELTPWAETEFQRCLEAVEEPLEDARRFFLTCWASVKGGPNSGPADFRWQKKPTRRSAAVRDVAILDHLLSASARLKNVQILNRDALHFIGKFLTYDCLIFFDPPYVHSVRTNQKGYRFETSDAWHRKAAALLCQAQGPVIVAGYPSNMYHELFEKYGWQRVTRPARMNSGGSSVDALWLSPITQKRLANNG